MKVLSRAVLDNIELDFCRRSKAAAVGFMVVFTILLVKPVATTPSYYLWHQLAAGLAFTCSTIRLFLGLYISREGLKALYRWAPLHSTVIVISSTCLGVVCSMGFWDPQNPDSKIFVTSFLVSAIMAGSATSLSLAPRISAYFLVTVGVMPGLFLAFSNHHGDLPYGVWTIFVFTFVVYVYGNSREFYQSMVTRYETEEALNIEKQNLTLAIQQLENTQDELLDQKSRAEYSAKLASLGEMAGGIAHEINTPLNVILLSAEQQMDLLQDQDLDRQTMKASIEKVQSTTNRIATIVRGLRIFARDGAKDPIESIPVQTLIDNTLSLCYEKFKLANVDLRLPAPTNLILRCRPVQISQVMLNLLNNSFEAIQDLPEKWIAIDVKELADQIEIRITDSGHGIDADIQAEIFRPFYTTKEIGKGTGLGLSISRGLIEAHHGQLYVDVDHPNTSFVIRLPK
ncbi:ATP-binding protein [Bdellovibrio sp. SKB1291214]|uniref:sensor histidine kinase n=1 Tax=Bdellovibrio sp. SKB1291214 TaxID=1732569 RepID=UPI000B518EAC|nr:ATP-binding protein [Bdellovibrio sp. SKB1291214]UYL08053.1 ATP-binding protein [Bdellovibrio sp. SKB1291214]